MEVPPFRVTTAVIGDVGLVSVSGELDLYTQDEFDQALVDVRASERSSVIVDCSAVSFIDSTAIGILAEHARRRRSDGGAVFVVSRDPRTLRVFEITGVDRIFRCVPTLHAALEELVPGHARPESVAV